MMDMAAIAQAAEAMPMPEHVKAAVPILHKWLDENVKDVMTVEERAKTDGVHRVEKFLNLILQIQKQHGISDEIAEPVAQLTLTCPECEERYAVSDANGYWQLIGQGHMFTCSNGHKPTIIFSGPHGIPSDVEQQVAKNEKLELLPVES